MPRPDGGVRSAEHLRVERAVARGEDRGGVGQGAVGDEACAHLGDRPGLADRVGHRVDLAPLLRDVPAALGAPVAPVLDERRRHRGEIDHQVAEQVVRGAPLEDPLGCAESVQCGADVGERDSRVPDRPIDAGAPGVVGFTVDQDGAAVAGDGVVPRRPG